MRDAASPSDKVIEQLAYVAEHNPSPILYLDFDGRLLYANRGSWMVLQHWNIGVGQIIPAPSLGVLRAAVANGETRETHISVGIVTVLLMFVPAADSGYVSVFGLNVSQHRHLEEKIELNAKVFEHASEGIIIMDEYLRVIDVNPAFSVITGYQPEDILGETVGFFTATGLEHSLQDEIWNSIREIGRWEGEIWDRRKSGERFAQWLSLVAVRGDNGSVATYIGLLADITSEKEAEDKLYRMAHYDSLTRLPNRRLLRDRLNQAVTYADRSAEVLALMIVDLDNFKAINDNVGHRAGDHLLRVTGERIKSCLRTSDTIARVGGDEFVILLRNVNSQADAETVARNVLRAICEPTTADGREVFVTASIGIALYPRDGKTIDAVLRDADNAMYSIKRSGKNDVRFSQADSNDIDQLHFTIQTMLRRGLDNHEFTVHYQPQVELTTGRIVGLEALARWQTDDLSGVTTPNFFIPVAENSGLIHRLGQQIFAQVCATGSAWRRAGISTGRIGVNISARQLRRDDFLAQLQQAMDEYGFHPEWLDIELTETVFIEEADAVMRKLEQLRSMEISLTIDDFGTKYASLSYLKRFSIDRLKIDQSFLVGIPDDREAAAIVETILAMALRLNISAVAEGVETPEQVDFLEAHGCRYIQGYLCSPPVAPEEIQPLLAPDACLVRRPKATSGSRFQNLSQTGRIG